VISDLRSRCSWRSEKTPCFYRYSWHGYQADRDENDKPEAEASEALAGSVILQTVADQTKNIQQLKREGYPLSVSDAKHLSPLLTRHLLQFGPFPLRCITELLPDNHGLEA